MDETTILLIRHAHVHNPARVFYGRLPRFRISELGLKQAAVLAAHLESVPLSQIYTSPMLRARQTAAIVAARHGPLPLHSAQSLVEVRTGWMGANNDRLPDKINLYDPPHSPDDETIADVWDRVTRFIWRLVVRNPGQTIACFSHGDPIVIAGAGFRGSPLALESIRGPLYPHQCSITTLRFDAEGILPSVSYFDVILHEAPDLASPY